MCYFSDLEDYISLEQIYDFIEDHNFGSQRIDSDLWGSCGHGEGHCFDCFKHMTAMEYLEKRLNINRLDAALKLSELHKNMQTADTMIEFRDLVREDHGRYLDDHKETKKFFATMDVGRD